MGTPFWINVLFAPSCLKQCVICSVLSDSLQPHGLYPTRLLCPWNSPGKNTGVGSHSLTPGDLPNPGIEPRDRTQLSCLHCKQILYCLSRQGSPEQCCYCSVAQLCLTLCNPMDCRRMWFSTKWIFNFLSIHLGTCWVCILDESIRGFPMYTQLFQKTLWTRWNQWTYCWGPRVTQELTSWIVKVVYICNFLSSSASLVILPGDV